MRKKLEGNGLWESSRMMLPEHKARINEHTESLKHRQRIELDVDEIEQVTRALEASYQNHVSIELKMFDKIEELKVIGVVERIDQLSKQFMVDGEWYKFADIEGVQADYSLE